MTTQWVIANTQSGNPLNECRYISERHATADLVRLGRVFQTLYNVIPVYEDQRWRSILVEGFRPGDLEGILLPQFSVDVYVPGDADTDNIVVGFLIKGVPEAVFPFKNFCTYTRGVKHVDYGDSDTLPHTSIVYVEFDREQFEVADFAEMIEQVCRVGSIKPEDMSITFPNTNKVVPYSLQVIEKYFAKRNVDRNRLEQWKANHSRAKQIQKEIEHEMDQGAIGSRLGPGDKDGPEGPQSLKQLKRPAGMSSGATPAKMPVAGLSGVKAAAQSEGDIPESTKESIIAAAHRNRSNHQQTWKDFDAAWAQRLGIVTSKVSSIRKQIYGGGGRKG